MHARREPRGHPSGWDACAGARLVRADNSSLINAVSVAPRLVLVLAAGSGCLFDDPGPGAVSADTEVGSDTGSSTDPGMGTSTGTDTDTGTGTEMPTTGEPPEQCGWEPRSPKDAPPARIDATLTLYEQRGTLVLYGGRSGLIGGDLGDTWSFDGSKWSEQDSGGGPGPRRGHAAAWDDARREVVLFGGEKGGADVKFAEKTWVYTDTGWSERDDGGPSDRAHAAMADLPTRARVVLFGGRTKDGPSDETWHWDGDKWSKVDPDVAPSPRFDHTMALDEASGKLLLHGGCATSLCGEPLTDTWAWDGEDWQQLDGGDGPGPRAGGMVYDRSEPALLRFGEGEGWRWGGETWGTAGAAPDALAAFAIAYHPDTAGVVLFGGLDAKLGATDDTWVFRCAR